MSDDSETFLENEYSLQIDHLKKANLLLKILNSTMEKIYDDVSTVTNVNYKKLLNEIDDLKKIIESLD